MAKLCCICNNDVNLSQPSVILSKNVRIYPSNRTLLDVVQDMIGLTFSKVDLETNVEVCKKCQDACAEYDEAFHKMSSIKSKLKNRHVTKKMESKKKPIVISKKALRSTSQNLNAAQSSKGTKQGPVITLDATLSTDSPDIKEENSVLQLSYNPDDNSYYFSTEMQNDEDMEDEETGNIKIETSENTLKNTKLVVTEDTGYIQDEDKSDEQEEMFVLGDVEMVEDDSESESTPYFIQNADGSIVKLNKESISGEEQISILVPDQDSGDEWNYLSDDESHLELQVSGDEDAAAIIAAATEEGGAFIKVSSGEMYEVKTVKSKVMDKEVVDSEHVIKKIENEMHCLLCDSEFDSEGKPTNFVTAHVDLMCDHIQTEHKIRVLICEVCGIVVETKAELDKHFSQHMVNYTCDTCNRTYKSKAALITHMKCHVPDSTVKCKICNKKYASKYTLQTHLKTHIANRPRKYTCHICKKKFLRQSNLKHHVLRHNQSKDFECTTCGKKFTTLTTLNLHQLIHTGVKPYDCNVCNKSFLRKTELQDHHRTHTGEKPFSCDVCGLSFAQRSNLLSHKKSTHLNEKKFCCTLCDKKYKRRRLLICHIQSAHTKERPYKCDECDSTFVYPEHFKKHKKLHKPGSKQYVCEICNKSFNSRDNMHMHRFVHSKKKQYECLVCGVSYMRKPQLYAHMNSCGHLTESIVVNEPKVSHVIEEENVDEEILDTKPDADQYLDEIRDNIGHEIVATDENGLTLHLVQVALPDGNEGWVALEAAEQ